MRHGISGVFNIPVDRARKPGQSARWLLPIGALLALLLIFGSTLPAGSPPPGGSMPLGSTLAPAAVPTYSAAPACTLYVAPTAGDSASGASPVQAVSIYKAKEQTHPGDVVCLGAGIYNIPHTIWIDRSGTASAWIRYRAYDGQAVLRWSSSQVDDIFQIVAGTRFIEISGLRLEGGNSAAWGMACDHATHVRFTDNTISSTGIGGLGTHFCDYVTIARNKVYHTGYGRGWGSGIALNSNQWSDPYPGFHNFVVGNIVSGAVDNSAHHSDGNGIILDLSDGTYAYSSANTPPALIANNLIYQNGGHCIHAYIVTSIWIVNNTCYKNGLDLRLQKPGEGGFDNDGARYGYVINNLSVAWNIRYNYSDRNGIPAIYLHNFYSGGSGNDVPDSILRDPNRLQQADPRFVDPMYVDPTADGQYTEALPPDQIGSRLQLQPHSPAFRAGIDPATLPGIRPEIRDGLRQWLATKR